MPEYGFSLTRIFPFKDRIEDTEKCGSEKTHILVYFTQSLMISYSLGKTRILFSVFMTLLLLEIFKNVRELTLLKK